MEEVTGVQELAELKQYIRDVPDFPKSGIVFKDITPLLQVPAAFRQVIDTLSEVLSKKKVDLIIGVESRGFIFSPALAYKMNIGFIPVRKKGKLPWHTHEVSYELEYGEAVLQIHQDALKKGQRIAIVDDLLATGGTAGAAACLVEKLGGSVEIIACLIELSFLKGRDRLAGYEVFSLLQY